MGRAEKKGELVQLGIFPGWKSPAPQAGEEKPRLDVVLTVKIRDNKTGEKFAREIHQDFHFCDDVHESLVEALSHAKTSADIERFVAGRSGFPESIKQERED